MQRLTGMDASFLYLETPTSHMHVAMTGIYDTSTMPNGYSFAAIKDHIASRLRLVPAFTWKNRRSNNSAAWARHTKSSATGCRRYLRN